jgi:SanA protein
MRTIKKIFRLILLIVVICIVATIYIYQNTSKKASAYIYSSIEEIPHNNTGIVLGTSKYTKNKKPNPYFYGRIAATEKLYKSGKIKYIIVSGDNRHKSYNEPMMMKRELIKRGIPDSAIFLDYAGLRTFDSVIRGKNIFGQRSYTLISQKFQIERAIVIAHHFGIGAIGFEAEEVSFPDNIQTAIREIFARILMVWDIYTLDDSEFLGKRISIPE